MRILLLILLFGWPYLPALGQPILYLRGEVVDEAGNKLPQVVIRQLSTGRFFKTDAAGRFDIPSPPPVDSFYFSRGGYLPFTWEGKTSSFLTVRLKSVLPVHQQLRPSLSSLSSSLNRLEQKRENVTNETYANLVENSWVNSEQFPSTGLSLNSDRASYSNIRRLLNKSGYVPTDAVRIEEMLNYFSPIVETWPREIGLFKMSSLLGTCPWNEANQLLQVQVATRKIDFDTLPSTHLVLLIDISESMDMPNRLPLLQSAFRRLVQQLREKDTVSIVSYGSFSAVLLRAVSGCEKDSINKVIDNLSTVGTTSGESGIKMAYKVAKAHFISHGNNRIILATDGDFNVGMRAEEDLEKLISEQRQQGIYLTCLGVGMGNYKDSRLQLLAQRGKGNFIYIDSEREAEKALMNEFVQTMYTVADNVYLQVSFSPTWIRRYRLIGFDNKASALLDSLSTIEGREMGSGHTLTALFEIEPSDSLLSVQKKSSLDTLAGISLRYNLPGDTMIHYTYGYLQTQLVQSSFGLRTLRFRASVALLGMLLKKSPFVKNYSWEKLILLTGQSLDPREPSQVEFLQLVTKAANLFDKKRRKKVSKR